MKNEWVTGVAHIILPLIAATRPDRRVKIVTFLIQFSKSKVPEAIIPSRSDHDSSTYA